MMTVFTTPGCGRCNILKLKLNSKQIPFVESTDYSVLEKSGQEFYQFPVIEKDGKFYTMKEIMDLFSL